jgi:hypothetical protein
MAIWTQATAVGQATGTATTAHSSSILSQLVSAVPNMPQGLASGDPIGSSVGSILGSSGDALDFGSGFTFIASGILFVLDPITRPLLVGPR